MNKKGFTTFQISKICGVYPTTVINWINQGKLKAYVTPGGHHRVTYEELISFLKEYNFPIPKELLTTKKKIYVVDDDEIFVRLVSKIFLKKKDLFDIFTFKDGYEALMNIKNDMPDLVVIDLVMPVMDGPTFCKKIKSEEEFKNIKIIAVTGEVLTEAKIQELKKITDGVFKKPIEPEEFLKFVSKLLGL
ncbi:MAG: response regulator [Elusimicrobiales bacterium]